MPVLPILTHPDPRLRLRAAPVEGDVAADAALQTLIDDMLETMYDAQGVGLAAPQVGVSRRLVVIDIGRRAAEGDAWEPDPWVLINPAIVEGDGELPWTEGCLSVPGVRAEVVRRARVVVEHLDRAGRPQRVECTGLRAVCVQHELDHLEGTLYVDRLGPLEQKLTLQDYERCRAEAAAPSPPA